MMENDIEKRRRHKRVMFSTRDGIAALFSIHGIQSVIPSTLLDLSAGGLSCYVKKNENLSFESGNRLILMEINDLKKFKLPVNTEIQIKWILDDAGHTGLGCQFMDIDEGVQKKITRFIGALEQYSDKKRAIDSVAHLQADLKGL